MKKLGITLEILWGTEILFFFINCVLYIVQYQYVVGDSFMGLIVFFGFPGVFFLLMGRPLLIQLLEPFGDFLPTILLPFVLNIVLLLLLTYIFKSKTFEKLKLFCKKYFLLIVWVINLCAFIISGILQDFYGGLVTWFLTWPWWIISGYILSLDSPVYLAFTMNSLILGIFTTYYLFIKAKQDQKV
ncbi:MAG: hypothetical protein GYA35_08710 [Thermoanaerobaculaceae bacterium]|nr:hypothetical protein [Thermoanaerobaculaceae bacterium]